MQASGKKVAHVKVVQSKLGKYLRITSHSSSTVVGASG